MTRQTPTQATPLVLRTTLTSPFGRKVRMAAEVLGIGDRMIVAYADTADPDDSLFQQNPLGKIPCLVCPDGTSLYDSGVIVEYLQDLAGNERLIPTRGPQRFAMFTRVRLADGIIDAGALTIYEPRYHPPEACSERWLDHQRGKIRRALDAFEADPPDPATSDALSIGLACALAFLDKRQPLEWRPQHPRLAAWLDAFARHEPAFEHTRAPAT